MAVTANLWRQETPGAQAWARPGGRDKTLIVSADTHVNEPTDVWSARLPQELAARLPRVETDEQGQKWSVIPGMRRTKLVFHEDEGDDEDKLRVKAARSPKQITDDMDRDGVDLQIAFPNRGLTIAGIGDPALMYPMASVYNDWLEETFRPVSDRVIPMAVLPTADLEMTLAELDRIARKNFFRGVMVPNKPIYGPPNVADPNYNLPIFDPLWASLQDKDLTVTFHVSTGMDPRGARGNGGAVINYAAHSLTSTVEPVTNLCASGVIERFPKLRFATIEAGIGWVPWLLEAMDEAYRKHYLWVRPKLSKMPSEYYLENGFSSFGEDPPGLMIAAQTRFADCFMWANDYPHHEGTWPHSAAAIERQMGGLTAQQRDKILGGNAVRCFRLQDLVAKRQAGATAIG